LKREKEKNEEGGDTVKGVILITSIWGQTMLAVLVAPRPCPPVLQVKVAREQDKELVSEEGQEVLAIIRCRIFCLPGCYPKL